ncbi:hypothetical protein [Petrachloros mirabilis]
MTRLKEINSLAIFLSSVVFLLAACTTNLPQITESVGQGESLVTGRVATVIAGERARIYLPDLRRLELVNRHTDERFSVLFKSGDQLFALSLAPGDYRVNRIQISEGPFLSMANVDVEFFVEPGVVTDLGTWRFGVDSPRYGRMVALSIVEHDSSQDLKANLPELGYPEQERLPTKRVMPYPSQSQARLYEVMPYPRYSRYFRRHNW